MAANIDWNSGAKEYGVVNFNDDKELVVTFYMKSVRDVAQTRASSLPIFKDVEYVKIMRPGEQLNIIDRPAEDHDRARFARQYHLFVDKKAQVPEGTPIDLLFPNNPSIADSLRARGVFTVQQCANLTAHAIDSIGMGGQEYVNRAKKYIEYAASGDNYIKMQAELDAKTRENALQARQIAELQAQMSGIMKKLGDSGNNPATGLPNMPGFVPGYDAQSERIASTHVTKELKK